VPEVLESIFSHPSSQSSLDVQDGALGDTSCILDDHSGSIENQIEIRPDFFQKAKSQTITLERFTIWLITFD